MSTTTDPGALPRYRHWAPAWGAALRVAGYDPHDEDGMGQRAAIQLRTDVGQPWVTLAVTPPEASSARVTDDVRHDPDAVSEDADIRDEWAHVVTAALGAFLGVPVLNGVEEVVEVYDL